MFLLAALMVGCFGSPETDSDPSAGPPPAKVTTAVVRGGDLDESWTTLGEVVPLDRSELAAGVAGPVSEVPRREGAVVAKGALLVSIDAGPASARAQAAQAAVAQARAQLTQAESDLGRLGKVDAGVLAPAELDAARTRVAALQASLQAAEAAHAEARVDLGRHRIRAPFAGVVTGRHVDPGDWVSPGSPVIDLVSAAAVEVRTDVTWVLGGKLSPGDAATARHDDGASLPMVVEAVVPALDPLTRTSRVRLRPAEPPAPEWLRPGAAVHVGFQVTAEGSGVIVPRDALVLAPGSASVVEVVDGAASPVPVTVLATGDTDALVTGEGLAAGDVVVTRGNERVRPGQPLQIEPAVAPDDGQDAP